MSNSDVGLPPAIRVVDETITGYPALPDTRSIRLFRARGFDTELKTFSGALETFNLDDCPVFYALSYTWDEATESAMAAANSAVPKLSVRVILSGNGATTPGSVSHPRAVYQSELTVSVSIGQNLHDFIEGFVSSNDRRPKSLPSRDSYLWIDAICIDQVDEHGTEKANQIALMGSIYHSAKCVLVWLGKDEAGFEDWKWLHEVFFFQIHKRVSNEQIEDITKYLIAFPKDVLLNAAFWSREYDLAEPTGGWPDLWTRLGRFTNDRRWFDRGWVSMAEIELFRELICQCVQEVALAQDILFYCGFQTTTSVFPQMDRKMQVTIMSYNLFWRLDATFIGFRVWDYFGVVGLRAVVYSYLAKLQADPEDVQIRTIAMLLLNSVNCVATKKTSLVADKVHSVIGLSQILLPSHRDEFTPPLDANVPQLFTWLSSKLLSLIGNLIPLSFSRDMSTPRLTNLPSWVADYSSHRSCRPIGFTNSFNAAAVDGPVPPRIDGDWLMVRGFQIGTIKSTYDAKDRTTLDILMTMRSVIHDMDRVYAPTGEDRVDVLLTMVYRVSAYPVPGGKTSGPPRSEIVRVYGGPERYPALHAVLDGSDSMTKEDGDAWSDLLTGMEDKWIKSPTFILEQRFFMTDTGYVGFVPALCEVNDITVILEGGRAPFVLRPQPNSNNYELVGDSHIRGCMYGELMTAKVQEQFRDFVLV